MPLSATLTEIKKPMNFQDGFGSNQSRDIYPSERHAALVSIAKAIGCTETLTGSKTYSRMDGDWIVVMNNTAAVTVYISEGAEI